MFFFILQVQEWIEKFNVDICLMFREQGQTKVNTYGEFGLNALIQGDIRLKFYFYVKPFVR